MSGVSLVRASATWIADSSTHVRIHDEAIERMAAQLNADVSGGLALPKWNFDKVHFDDGSELTAQYILVVDALNFCFWPDEKFDYCDLASGLRSSLQEDGHCLDADRLASLTGPELRSLLRWPRVLPLEEERTRLLNEVGLVLGESFGGQAANLIRATGGSAARLVDLVTSSFRGFQDHSVYKGRQVAFYKRAQIFVGDIWGAFQGQGLGCFTDLACLTMFADYLVPCILHTAGVLTYSAALEERVRRKDPLLPGSEEEVELRGCSIAAVERLRERIHQTAQHELKQVSSVELDWWLWSRGLGNEASIPHHRTLTVYY